MLAMLIYRDLYNFINLYTNIFIIEFSSKAVLTVKNEYFNFLFVVLFKNSTIFIYFYIIKGNFINYN